jgi:hypothetical protein
MSICPQHGGYTGECKKCNNGDTSNGVTPVTKVRLELSIEDKCTLLQMENETLEHAAAIQALRDQMNGFVRAMFEKHGLKPAEYVLDQKTKRFVTRGL